MGGGRKNMGTVLSALKIKSIKKLNILTEKYLSSGTEIYLPLGLSGI